MWFSWFDAKGTLNCSLQHVAAGNGSNRTLCGRPVGSPVDLDSTLPHCPTCQRVFRRRQRARKVLPSRDYSRNRWQERKNKLNAFPA